MACAKARAMRRGLVIASLLVVLLWPAAAADAQSASVGGDWSGQLTQTSGATTTLFTFSLHLVQGAAGVVAGTTRIEAYGQPQRFGAEAVTGTFSGGAFTFQEGGVFQATPGLGASWCVKSGTLTLSPDGTTLSGDWQAPGCAPGTITVHRTPSAPSAGASGCRFILGFAALAARLPGPVGQCVADQAFAANGDATQPTTGGLLVWRKADNWTAFTDGYRTWVNGPDGLQERLNTERFGWEANPDGLPIAR